MNEPTKQQIYELCEKTTLKFSGFDNRAKYYEKEYKNGIRILLTKSIDWDYEDGAFIGEMVKLCDAYGDIEVYKDGIDKPIYEFDTSVFNEEEAFNEFINN